MIAKAHELLMGIGRFLGHYEVVMFRSVIATVTMELPFKIAVNSATNRIYVANQISNTVSVIDGATRTVMQLFP
jgi:DNA-binding beta-propeller fold protein YncE